VWVPLFLDNRCSPKAQLETGEITLEEIMAADMQIITHAQLESLPEEFQLIVKENELSHSSKLLQLWPVIGEDGILRCDGRLEYAEFIPLETRSNQTKADLT